MQNSALFAPIQHPASAPFPPFLPLKQNSSAREEHQETGASLIYHALLQIWAPYRVLAETAIIIVEPITTLSKLRKISCTYKWSVYLFIFFY